MSWYKIAESKTKMKEWFDKRTKKHIKSVQKYCEKIEDYDPDRFKGLSKQAKTHDASKFKDPENDAYIYVTWKCKCKDDGIDFEAPKTIDEDMLKATVHHVKNNKHHPEHYSNQKNVINRDDRNEPPDEIVDGTKMPIISIGEMMADWFSVAKEKGTDPKAWADKNVNIRWKFTDEQKDVIYELIDEVWND